MIALIGGAGSIGRRYQACLNHLKTHYRVIELDERKKDLEGVAEPLEGITKAIIATPTDTHMSWCRILAEKNIPFLCEKPMSTKNSEIKELIHANPFVKAWVVNNWALNLIDLFGGVSAINSIRYNFFNTGKDGLVWDACQLIELSLLSGAQLEIRTDSFWWDVNVNGFPIPYFTIEQSYLKMIQAFIDNRTDKLWNLQHALQMTEMCEAIEKQIGRNPDGFYFYSSTERIEAIAR